MRLKWKKGKKRNTAEVVKRNAVAKEPPVLVNNHPATEEAARSHGATKPMTGIGWSSP